MYTGELITTQTYTPIPNSFSKALNKTCVKHYIFIYNFRIYYKKYIHGYLRYLKLSCLYNIYFSIYRAITKPNTYTLYVKCIQYLCIICKYIVIIMRIKVSIKCKFILSIIINICVLSRRY